MAGVAALGARAAALAADAPAPGGAAPTAQRWGMSEAQEGAWRQIEAAARKEGKLTYYSLGSVPEAKAELLKSLFAKDYPGIELTYLNVGNTSALTARLTAEQQSGTYVADVFDQGVLFARLVPDLAAFLPPAAVDPSAKWLENPIQDDARTGLVRAEFMQIVVIWINTNLVKAADAPKGYADLADPKWKGRIIWREPWSAGGGSNVFILGKRELGPDWIAKMANQDLTFNANQDAALLQVARGEFAVGIGLTGRTAGQLIRDNQPLAAVWPVEFAASLPIGTQILKNAPHPNAARVFCNWMLTTPGQRLWRDLGQFPLRTDVTPAEPWMAGVSKARILSSTVPQAVQAAGQKEAEKLFKK